MKGSRDAGNKGRRGFSVVELLIALAISGMLLSACLVALDSTFKSYESTTDAASTHVVSRLVMSRITTMIRTGKDFGPYPIGIVRPTRLTQQVIEFVSLDDQAAGRRQVTRLESADDPAMGDGMRKLLYKRWDYEDGAQVGYIEYPLVRNLLAASFTMEFDVGPRLRRATVDLTIKPDDSQASVISSDLEAPTLRLISTTVPRRLD